MSIIPFQYLPELLALDESAFSKIGISITNPDGSIRNTYDILEELNILWEEGLEKKIKEMIAVDKEEILDFPHSETYGAE